MVEIFQGKHTEVKRQLNDWFRDNQDIGVEYVLQDVVFYNGALHSELTITVVYTEEYRGGSR